MVVSGGGVNMVVVCWAKKWGRESWYGAGERMKGKEGM
jgi:hypothetical protein